MTPESQLLYFRYVCVLGQLDESFIIKLELNFYFHYDSELEDDFI